MIITEKFIEENKGKRFDIELTDGTKLKSIGFFVASNYRCYMTSRQRTRGRVIPWDWRIKTIVEVIKDKPTATGNAKKILKRLHFNAWSNLKEEYEGIVNGDEPSQDFKWHFMGKLKFRNISSELNTTEKFMLNKAFENKEDFRWSRSARGAQGRDLSIETKLCDDGIFKAWFSSEYAGCGNGDYYLLLNPTTAIYYERD